MRYLRQSLQYYGQTALANGTHLDWGFELGELKSLWKPIWAFLENSVLDFGTKANV